MRQFTLHVSGLSCGEVTQPFLLQQLGNPNAGQRDRETLLAVLNFFNQPEPLPNAAHSQIASPNIMAQHQQQNPVGNTIQHQSGTPINHDLLQSQHLFLQHQAATVAAAQKQQLRISPLPNGNGIYNLYNINIHISFL